MSELVTPVGKLTQEKRWRHYCDGCVYLGTTEDSEGDKHDLYVCDCGPGVTLIDRYGGEPPEYVSGVEFATSLPMLRYALKLVIEGYLHLRRATCERDESWVDRWFRLGYRVEWSDQEPCAYEVRRVGCLPSDNECLARLPHVQDVEEWVQEHPVEERG